jgi:hypothetical protein
VSVSTSGTTFAITTNGDLYGWGYTENGQVGNGKQDREDNQTTPVKVLSKVVSVTATYTNTAAITTNGDLYCWGNNAAGQIGNGQSGFTDDPLSNGIMQETPVKVFSNVVSATIMGDVSSAITKNGELYCWGYNGYYYEGDEKIEVTEVTPVKVLSNVRLPNVKPTTPEIKATPTASKVLVDGKSVAFDAYNISGNNYFKLRDLAYVLNSSSKEFSVAWDGENNAIALESGKAYTAVGGEMATKGTATVNAASSTSVIMLNGSVVKLTAYNIANNNYFKLRDVGTAFDFDVSWSNTEQTIVIDTTRSYTAD